MLNMTDMATVMRIVFMSHNINVFGIYAGEIMRRAKSLIVHLLIYNFCLPLYSNNLTKEKVGI
jgi:hypothetical protein